MVRTISFLDGKAFVLLRRKGQVAFQWEEILPLTSKGISPLHLLLHYVSMTAKCGVSGGPLFLQHKKPYKPVSANTIRGG